MLTSFYTLTIVICIVSSILSNAQSQNEYDVIIMGAGSAGISAAKTLYEAGITNILIIEAQWFIGGRTVVHHFDNYNYYLNIGASWISGACMNNTNSNCAKYNQTNPMLDAANKYNFSYVISHYERGMILDFGGTEHNVTNSNNRMNTFWEAQECAGHIMKNVTKFNHDTMSFFTALYLCGWKTPHNTIDKTIQWLNYEFEGQHAKWSIIGHGEDDTYDVYGHDDLFIIDERGYQGIIKALASEFIDVTNVDNDDKIVLNSPITAIKYNETGVIVRLENTTEYSAKYGIATFSIGVLQSDIVEFVPKLPPWKINTLLDFDYVDYVVILIKWPYRFWNDEVGNSEFIILNEDRFGFFPWIYNLDHPNLYNGSLIWRFDISLDLARLVQYQSKNDTTRMIIDLKLSHYFDDIPEPDDVFIGPWHDNKYIQGSYSNWPPGFSQDDKDAMSWPIKRLFFAGEAFSDFDYGFVHTAWLSGNDTANKILSCMGYPESVTYGLKCPSEYVPPSKSNDCKNNDESTLNDFVWLWIILAIIFGIILGYLFATYFKKIIKNKRNTNYGAVDDIPMITQDTT